MDTKSNSRIPQCGDAPDLRRTQLVVGAKQLRKALAAGRADRVFLAENADPGVTAPLAEMSAGRGVPVTWVADMASLGRACGIDVAAAAAAWVH